MAFRCIGIMGVLALTAVLGCHRGSSTRPPRPQPDSSTAGGYVVNFDDETRNKVARVEELIAGRFPGVTVRRTNDGGYSVNIRGVGSFMSSEEPLYVVDGVTMTAQGGRGLSWLSPADVVRIEVLRDPSQTSMYGVRGANGVILITTRRP